MEPELRELLMLPELFSDSGSFALPAGSGCGHGAGPGLTSFREGGITFLTGIPGMITSLLCCRICKARSRKMEVVFVKWMIVTDSSCDLTSLDTGSSEIGFETVPFILNIDQKDYTDDLSLSVPELVDAMEASSASHSACPSPSAWEEAFRKADSIIAFTISGRLSGSYNSAMVGKAMAMENAPDKQIEVIDSLSTGPKLVMLVQSALRQIQDGVPFSEICAACRTQASSVRTIFTLSSFHNLVQNGRVSRIAGFLAGKLGIRVIGIGSPEGEIQLKELMRGEQRTLKKIIRDMEENGYSGTPMTISHCLNEPMARSLKELIRARWTDASVQVLPTRGLDSYYAERSGLIICYPTRG